MKIGLITFQRAHNFGAVLQAYGIKTMLEDLGHEVIVIDYWPTYRKGIYKRFDFSFIRDFKMSFKNRINVLIMQPSKYKRHQRFEYFISKHLGLSGSSKILKGEQIPDECEIYVYGSDQIWRSNPAIHMKAGFDEVYWGNYPVSKARKITYAASMGILAKEDEHLTVAQQYLKNFDAISVREVQLKKLVEPLTSHKISHVLDPVFLLSPEKWRSIMSDRRGIDKKYMIIYNRRFSSDASDLARRIADTFGLEIVEISEGKSPLEFKRGGGSLADGPLEFVRLFAHTDFVISTSFHGVAFSVLFQKQFLALGMGTNSDRVISILGKLGIPDNLVSNINQIKADNLSKIDYAKVTPKLNELRKESIQFLRENIDRT